MRMSFRNQERRLAVYLPELKSAHLSFEGLLGLPEKTIRSRIPVSGPPCDLEGCDLDFLFHYDVFPPALLKFFGEWHLYDRAMRVGDVIVQQVQIPPVGLGITLVFGSRVLSVYRSSRTAGFSYGTLTGHPETGTNEFSLSVEEGSLSAAVRTVAAPGLFLSRLLAPVFTKPYVAFCTARALQRMKDSFLRCNPSLQWSPQ